MFLLYKLVGINILESILQDCLLETRAILCTYIGRQFPSSILSLQICSILYYISNPLLVDNNPYYPKLSSRKY
jgi:hypothetical protein